MKKLLFAFAAAAAVLAGCTPESAPSDITGTWYYWNSIEENGYTFNSNGTFVRNDSEISLEGNYTLKDGIITFAGTDSPLPKYKIKKYLNDNLLVLAYVGEEKTYSPDVGEILVKKGKIVTSDPVEGRWDALYGGDGEEYVATVILNGGKADLYIDAWCEHYVGTYDYLNGTLSIKVQQYYWINGHLGTCFDQETFEAFDGFEWSSDELPTTSVNLPMLFVGGDEAYGQFANLNLRFVKHK